MEFIYLIIGFVLLIKFADIFVDSSVNLAKYFKISEIIIGATIVSIGTTLPETLVSAVSAVKGHGSISFGNAIGSIICNTAFIAAIPIIVAPGIVDKNALKNPTRFFYVAFFVYAILAYGFGEFNRVAGIVLVLIFVIYIIVILRAHRAHPYSEGARRASPKGTSSHSLDSTHKENLAHKRSGAPLSAPHSSPLRDVLTIIASGAVIAFASNLLVDNGVIIARKFNVSESVIGITIIALGTSLPELTTAITSLVKGHGNLSLGNIIGADFMNLVSVTGIAALLNPFRVPTEKMVMGINSSFIIDIPFALFAVTLLCVPSIITGKTKRWQGVLLLVSYIIFIIYQYIH